MKNIHETIKPWITFVLGITERKLVTYAAAGAYYMFLSLPPMLILLCSLLPYTPLSQADAIGAIQTYVPDSFLVILEKLIGDIYSSTSTTLTLSILLTAWSASASMRALMQGMDAAAGARRRMPLPLYYVLSVFYMIILILTLLISLCVMVYGGHILDLAERFLSALPILGWLHIARYLRFAVVFLILAGVFTILYRWIPAVRLRFRDLWPGSLFSAVIWVIFSLAFTVYTNFSNRFGAYGLIGSAMVAMMWMYFCLLFLLIGAWLNHFMVHLREEKAVSLPEEQ